MDKNGVLYAREFPFVLTLLFGGAAVLLNHLITRVSEAPLIEYYELSEVEPGKREYGIVNLSNEKAFSKLVISICTEPGSTNEAGEIVSGVLDPEPPADQTDLVATTQNGCSRFEVAVLNPKAEFKLVIKYIGIISPTVYLNMSDSQQAVMLVERSAFTYLLRNEFVINIVLLGIWILLIILYLFLIKVK